LIPQSTPLIIPEIYFNPSKTNSKKLMAFCFRAYKPLYSVSPIKWDMKTIKVILILTLPVFLFSACKKDSTKKTSSATSEYYFKGSLNGKATDWEAATSQPGWAAGSSAAEVNDAGDISGGLTAELTYFPAEKPVFGIEFKTFDKSLDADANTVFNNFVKTGTWSFASTPSYPKGVKSIVIHYTDANGNEYSSIGAQSGAANVVSVTPVTGDQYNSDPGLKIKITFSCTLYPASGTGSVISISNAETTVFLENLINY